MKALISFLLFSVAVAPAYTQDQDRTEASFRVRLESPAAWYVWADSRNELITSGGLERREDSAAPNVNIYNVVTRERRSIDIRKDLPDAKKIYVESIAAGPSGTVLVACELSSKEKMPIGDHLLLYNQHSVLTTNVTTPGYDIGAVAADQQGNFYFVGSQDSERSSKESYPLLVRYDPHGRVTLKALPRSLFPNVDDPVGDGIGAPSKGATRLIVSEKGLEVYLAPASEMVILSREGEIQRRVNVALQLSEFAKASGYKTVHVSGNGFSPSGELWFVGQLEEPQDARMAALPARNFVVRLTPEGHLQVPYSHVGSEPPGHYLPWLLGFTESDEPVGYRVTQSDDLVVQKRPY